MDFQGVGTARLRGKMNAIVTGIAVRRA